jgi:hypothetical protein
LTGSAVAALGSDENRDSASDVLIQSIHASDLSFAPRLKLRRGEIGPSLESLGLVNGLGALGGSRFLGEIKLPDGGVRVLEVNMEYAGGPSFRTYVYGLILNLFCNQHLWKIARCGWCEKFFARAHVKKDVYCSDECYTAHESYRSKVAKHKKRAREEEKNEEREVIRWLTEQFQKPTRTDTQQKAMYRIIVEPLFGRGSTGWAAFRRSKQKLQEFWESLPEQKKALVYKLATQNVKGGQKKKSLK